MKNLKVVVALPGENNYLREQEGAAKETARRLGIELTLMNANSDAVTQSQQLLEIVQSQSAPKPDAIIVEPVTAIGLPRVAEAAVAADVAWVVSNAEVSYLGYRLAGGLDGAGQAGAVGQPVHRRQGEHLAVLVPAEPDAGQLL
ncbi:MAG TPA: substrate-binding domain-containing protein, partial [Candidatus Angelobacter sp.]